MGNQSVATALMAAWACVIALGGCSPAPLQETKNFQQAFTAVDTVGQPLLDDLAIAERKQGQDIAVQSAKRVTDRKLPLPGHESCAARWFKIDRSTGFIDSLCPVDVAYFSQIGDPPKTQTFRKALALMGQFAQALVALADGTSAALVSAQVQQLAQNAASLAGLTGEGAGVGAAVTGLATALKPLIDRAAGAASAAQERQVILDAQPKIATLIKALHDAAPAVFATLIEQSREQIELEDHPQPAEATRPRTYLRLVSEYMSLLDQLGQAWDLLVVAARQPSTPTSLAALAVASGQVTADAAEVRQSLAVLRSGVATK